MGICCKYCGSKIEIREIEQDGKNATIVSTCGKCYEELGRYKLNSPKETEALKN